MAIGATDIVAIIGAAAWLPQIVGVILRVFVRANVTVLPDQWAEIGFTGLGPIFNVRLAFAVSNKDAVIDSVFLTVTHEDGGNRSFKWKGMLESYFETRGPNGVSQTQKELPPIAFKLGTSILVERFFRFQDAQFDEGKPRLDAALRAQVNYLRNRSQTYRKEVLSSREADALREYFASAFSWRAGKYKVEFGVHSPDRIRTRARKYSFTLSEAEVGDLRCNQSLIPAFIDIDVNGDAAEFKGRLDWAWKILPLIPEG